MEEKQQAINSALDTNKQMVLKFLQILCCLHAANLAISLIRYLPIPYELTDWTSRILSVGMIVCLFALTNVNCHYRVAGIMRAVILIRNVVFALLPATVLFSLYENPVSAIVVKVIYWAVLVLSWLATYCEYRAHGALSATGSEKLAKQWNVLFVCALLVAVLGSGLSYAAAYLSWITLPLNNIISVVIKVMDLAYLWLLYQLVKNIRGRVSENET